MRGNHQADEAAQNADQNAHHNAGQSGGQSASRVSDQTGDHADHRRGDAARPAEPRPGKATAASGPTWLADEATIALRLLILGIAAMAVLWFIRQVEIVVIAAFLGFAVTAMLWPAARVLRRFLPGVAAAMLTVSAFLASFLLLLWFITAEVVSSWPVLQGAVIGAVESLDQWVRDHGVSVPSDLVDNLLGQLQSRAGAVVSGIGEAALTGLNALSLAATVLVVTLFLTIFALSSGSSLARQVTGAVPAARREAAAAALRTSFTAARWWLVASTVTGLVDGLLIGVGMQLLGLPLAIPVGVLTFVLGFIPMLGATLAGLVAVLIGIFFAGPLMGVWVLLLVLAVQQIEGNVLSPLLMSRAMQFHPIVTLLVITAGGFAFGFTGLFLAVPLTGVAAAAVRGWRGVTRPDVPGPEPAPEPAAEPSVAPAPEPVPESQAEPQPETAG